MSALPNAVTSVKLQIKYHGHIVRIPKFCLTWYRRHFFLFHILSNKLWASVAAWMSALNMHWAEHVYTFNTTIWNTRGLSWLATTILFYRPSCGQPWCLCKVALGFSSAVQLSTLQKNATKNLVLFNFYHKHLTQIDKNQGSLRHKTYISCIICMGYGKKTNS